MKNIAGLSQRNGLNRPIFSVFAAAVLMGGFFAANSVNAATTLNVSSDAVNFAYRNVVVKAADRLAALQNADGGWNWDITDATAPGGSTSPNIVGVAAEALLDSYQLTGNSDYLNAAKKAGDYLKSRFGNPIDITKRTNAFDIVFLYNLGQAGGDGSYTDEANAILHNTLHEDNFFAHVNDDGYGNFCSDSTGCTAQNVFDGASLRRGGDLGITLWDLSHWLKAAELGGETSWAADLKTLMDNSYPNLSAADGYYILGLSELVSATGNTSAKEALIAAQQSDGRWTDPNGDVQDTAYALMALKSAGDDSHVSAAANYLNSNFSYNSLNGWKETDGSEISEVTSEAADALFNYFHQAGAYYTIQDAINAATSGDTINIAAGTYGEQLVITKNLTIQGAGDTTITKPSSQNILASFYTLGTQTDAFWNGKKLASIIDIDGAGTAGALIKDLKVDGANLANAPVGADYNVGISLGESSGTLDSVRIVNMNTVSGSPRTYGVWLDSVSIDAAVEIKNSTVADYNKNGINVRGSKITANISDNAISGPGAISTEVPNGVLLINGAKGVVNGNTIYGNKYGGDTYKGSGVLLYSAGDGITVENNTIHDSDEAVLVNSTNSAVISGNTLRDGLAGIHLEAGSAENVITTNAIQNNTYGIRLDGPGEVDYSDGDDAGTGNSARANSFTGNTENIRNWIASQFNAASNWWDSTDSAGIAGKVNGSVSYDPWYMNPGRTILSSAVAGSTIDASAGNFDLVASSSGRAGLPSGVTNLTFSDSTKLDLHSSVASQSGSFTGGNLNSVDLTVAQTVGDISVIVEKSVNLRSGADAQPIILVNSNLSNMSLKIPDNTTVLAPNGWDGMIAPPKTGTGSGTAPSGFSVGSTVIDVGSSNGVLLFDKPVSVVLTGVTGSVGYKPSGSATWSKITEVCGGSYDSPSAPTFPGECAISNGTDTKIYTYHLTAFASLTANPAPAPTPAPSSGGGGGGGGSYIPPITTHKVDSNNDGKVDLLDFNTLMANWGSTGNNIADFNGDGKVDVLDFNSLMINWTI